MWFSQSFHPTTVLLVGTTQMYMDTDGYRNATKETALVASYNNQEPLLARIWPKKLKKKWKVCFRYETEAWDGSLDVEKLWVWGTGMNRYETGMRQVWDRYETEVVYMFFKAGR